MLCRTETRYAAFRCPAGMSGSQIVTGCPLVPDSATSRRAFARLGPLYGQYKL